MVSMGFPIERERSKSFIKQKARSNSAGIWVQSPQMSTRYPCTKNKGSWKEMGPFLVVLSLISRSMSVLESVCSMEDVSSSNLIKSN